MKDKKEKDKFERMVDASPFTLWDLIHHVAEAYSHLVPLSSEMTGEVLSRKINDTYESPVSAFYAEIAKRYIRCVKRHWAGITLKMKEGVL